MGLVVADELALAELGPMARRLLFKLQKKN
jgi:hypothetical protein